MSIRTSLSSILLFALAAGAAPDSSRTAQAHRALELAPVRFEQAGTSQFAARGLGYQMALSPAGTTLTLPASQFQLLFLGANPYARMEGLEPMRARTDYYRGADRSAWRTGVTSYRRVRCIDLYPGIDLVYYASGGRLEYDFIVAPGADPSSIRMKYAGAQDGRISRNGDLVIRSGEETIVQRRPTLYQTGGRAVGGRFQMAKNGVVSFGVDPYDRSQQLIIDPVLTYTTYLNGNGGDFLTLLSKDVNGYLYVAGYTSGSNITPTGSPVKDTPPGDKDIFVVKLDPNAPPDSTVVYATYLGGTGADIPKAMTVDANGVIYLTGSTSSSDFPTSGGALQKTLVGGTDSFFVKLSTTDGLLYSTYNGSTLDDSGEAIAYDGVSKVYIAGNTVSTDFPVSADAMQSANAGQRDTYLVVYEFYADGSGLPVYTSYFGGESSDVVRSIALDNDGGVWIAGYTASANLPMAGDSFRNTYSGFGDVFVAKLMLPQAGSPAHVAYSTYLGGSSSEDALRVLVDTAGGVIVTGYTLSDDFPLTDNALQKARAGSADVFVSRLDPSKAAAQALTYSTLLGGSGADVVYDATVDSQNTVYLTGYTMSRDFPVTANAYQSGWSGLADAFVTRIDPSKTGSEALLYSTYLGSHSQEIGYGIETASDGKITVAGITRAAAFPENNPIQRAQADGVSGSFTIVLDPK